MISMEKMRMKFLIDPQIEETLISDSKNEVKKENMKIQKVKIDEIREENERLKLRLCQVMEDYHSLKKQFKDDENRPMKLICEDGDGDDQSELVLLSLGRSSVNNSIFNEKKTMMSKSKVEDEKSDGLELGLDSKFYGENSTEEILPKNESIEKGSDAVSAPNSPRNSRNGDDDVMRHSPPLKKPRVSVRAFCNTQTMNDGCQWRKYGQKIAKGNPCPRAYYRCTISTSCPVRKQVQRCADDMTILTTTYEGTHNHPLPPAATTMASTTAAAVAMLNCNSSTTTATTTSPPQHNLPTTIPGFNLASPFPNIKVSTTQSHPTVVLDLTTPNRYSTTNIFPSSLSSSSLFSNVLSSTNSLSFSSSNPSNPKNNALLRNMMSSSSLSTPLHPQPFAFGQTTHDEKVAAATKAITDNPSFQSALAAAITSFVGSKVETRNSSGLDFQLNFSQPSESNVRAHRPYRDMLL